MHDRVADVLAQRASLDRGNGTAIALSLLLHGGLTALALYAALHASPVKQATMVNIQFAKMPAAAPSSASKSIAKPKVEAPKITAPKPPAEKKPPKVEKNTVPFSPFGRSTKKGSETPPIAKPVEPPAPPAATTSADIPIGGAGVTGLEGGDFPYTLYIQAMQRRVGTNWFRPQDVSGIATVIYFRIERDGTILDSRIETPSGNPTFDRAALGAVRSSTPLPPLPFGYTGTYLGVHLTFR